MFELLSRRRKEVYDLKVQVETLRLENDRLRARIDAQAAVIHAANAAAEQTQIIWANYNKKAA